MIGDFASDLLRKNITVGVAGFARAGKTVFIGSAVQALVCAGQWKSRAGRGPLAQFSPLERGYFGTARIRDDINTELPQFPFRKVRDSLVGLDADWPEPTEGMSHLVIDVEHAANHVFWSGTDTVRIEFIDYPGEWLIDLPMLKQDYWAWSQEMLDLGSKGWRSGLSSGYRQLLQVLPGEPPVSEDRIEEFADAWRHYLEACAAAGLTFNQPGRLLRPDKLKYSPVLRLFPLPDNYRETAFGKELARRFEDYKKKVIKPFYQDVFARMDRQVVLVDVLKALKSGEEVYEDMVRSLTETMKSFRYGKDDFLSRIFSRAATHVLFAATKCDHVTRGDRANLAAFLRKMVGIVDDCNHIRSQVARLEVLALASVRATEDRQTKTPPVREILYGQPNGAEDSGQWDPGGLPLDVPPLWDKVHFEFHEFRPALMPNAINEGFPAINLGKALDFLVGEKLNGR